MHVFTKHIFNALLSACWLCSQINCVIQLLLLLVVVLIIMTKCTATKAVVSGTASHLNGMHSTDTELRNKLIWLVIGILKKFSMKNSKTKICCLVTFKHGLVRVNIKK